ncbi:MAG: hypothetical protein HRT68_04765 [Flavobacteriaceae bacterium]|nr:hypothetical protein [Flavobacteriaceae bacterium]
MNNSKTEEKFTQELLIINKNKELSSDGSFYPTPYGQWDEYPSGYGPVKFRGDDSAREASITKYGPQKFYMYHNGNRTLTEYADQQWGFVAKKVNNKSFLRLNLDKGFGAK